VLRQALFTVVLVAASMQVATADPNGIRFKLVNRGGYALEKVFVSPTGTANWGDDLLKGRVLRTGQSLVLHLKGGCGLYDLRFVGQAGVEYMDEEVQFCDDDDIVTVDKSAIKKSKPAK